MSQSPSDQERFWCGTQGQLYMARNQNFDGELGVECWRRMLTKANNIESILECGSNIGRNIGFLEQLLPKARKSIIELSDFAFREVTSRYELEHAFNGPILESDLPAGVFDLVFTNGVLIHIHPNNLLANMRKMFHYSRRYILIAEYFSRTPVMISYHGEEDRLFKSDFGKTFAMNLPVNVVDYGFLWGHQFDSAGFDDITWWLFEKRGAVTR